MSRLYFLSLAAFAGSLLSLSVRAEDPSEAVAPVERYQPKNRSSFTASKVSRAPFWPIGYAKIDRNVQAPVAPVKVTKLDAEMFAVTSILLGNPSLAVINGRAYGEGEYLRLPKPSAAGPKVATKTATLDPTLRIRIARITDGAVSLQSADGQVISVPLRRRELNEPKPAADEESLLSEQ